MSKIFAPEFDRTEEGWVIFPRDTELRHQYFPYTDPTEHPAKQNMVMVRELVEFVSEIGETICDPFGGTGTTLVAVTVGRPVIMIELLEVYYRAMEINVASMKRYVPDVLEYVNLIQGNSASILPIPELCDHMIFSPPYPMGLKKKGELDKTSKDLGYGQAAQYSDDEQNNFTNMSDFIYHQKIEEFYKRCFLSIRAGGTMTVIIKDRMEKGQRVMQADRTLRDCIRIGFELVARNKWYAVGGGYSAINRAAGLQTVMDEDLITLRVPALGVIT